MRLYVARHAECDKNLIGIPGGVGSSLTPRGIGQAHYLAEYLLEAGVKVSEVGVCPPIQTHETGNIVAARLGLLTQQRDELRSIGLGVLAGVPISEARQLYPTSSTSMDLWRSGAIELAEVKIKGMEDPTEFFCRGLRYIMGLLERKAEDLVVATTSIMILFDNLHRMHGPAPGEGYVVREYDNTALLTLDFSPDHREWLFFQARKYGLL